MCNHKKWFQCKCGDSVCSICGEHYKSEWAGMKHKYEKPGLVFLSILKEAQDYREKTGIDPTRLYLGLKLWNKLKEDSNDLLRGKVNDNSKKEILGMKVFIIVEDDYHLNVA